MASWANPTVDRLAKQEVPAGEFCGLVVNCSWPMPAHVVDRYEAFRKELEGAMPAEAYVYPASTLHCTACTLKPFTSGPLDAAAREAARARWEPVLAAARRMEAWPAAPFRLRMGAPTLEGSAGIFRFKDTDGAIGRARDCLRAAVAAAGGRAAEGADWSEAAALPGSPASDPAPHMPNIVHSTVLRWRAEPADREAAKEAFDRVAATWEPTEVSVPRFRAVWEDVPYMHIPDDGEHIWWESESQG